MSKAFVYCLLACLAGCSGTSSNEAKQSVEPSASPIASAPASGEPTPDPSASPSATSGASLTALPADLQSDAYHYFGLSNDKEVPLQMEQSSGSGPAVVSQGGTKSTLHTIDKDSASFDFAYTGELSSTLGTSQLKLSKDGIHALSTSLGKTKGDDMELPAKLSPGTTWRTKSTVQAGADTIEEDITYKVIGPQKVDTKATSYLTSLYVIGKGTMKRGGKTYSVNAKSWYVKDRGAVRQEMKINTAPPTSITIQERKAS